MTNNDCILCRKPIKPGQLKPMDVCAHDKCFSKRYNAIDEAIDALYKLRKSIKDRLWHYGKPGMDQMDDWILTKKDLKEMDRIIKILRQ